MGKNIELEQLVINKLTQEQYDALAVKNPGELYFITDANPTKEVETQLAELSEKVPEPISTYESFPEATAENVGMRVVYTGDTIEAPYIENEDGSVSTVFLDPYLTRGHTFMLVPVQVLISDTESITIYMWQDVIGAIPPFDYDMAGQVLSTNGMGYEWTELPEAGITKEEADQTYLPLSGGTMTGPLQMNIVGDKNTCFVVERQLNDSSPVYSWNIEFSRSTPAIYLKSNYGTPCVFYNNSIIPGSFSATFGSSASKWSKIYALTLNNGEDLIVPTEGGTLARLEDIPESTQAETIPEASADNVGKVLQYIGETNETYTNGYFYKSQGDTTTTEESVVMSECSGAPITMSDPNNLLLSAWETHTGNKESFSAYYMPSGEINLGPYPCNGEMLYTVSAEDVTAAGITVDGYDVSTLTSELGFDAVYTPASTTIENLRWEQVSVQPASETLPDQTDNAGKFLQTNGTEVSWGNALVNTTEGTGSVSINSIGIDTKPKYSQNIGGRINGQSSYSVSIGFGSLSSAFYSVAIGVDATASAQSSIAIGGIASADNAIQLGHTNSGTKNPDANTFKVANQNGNFEIMSSDGTIPTDRYTTTPTAAGTYVPKLTIAEDGTTTREWGTESGGESLPDQTNNAGKFLTTDGTTASWSEALTNNSTKLFATAVGSFSSATAGGSAFGYSAIAGYTNSVAIGYSAKAQATNAIQLGQGTNFDEQTFKVANTNGNFEIMDAQGNIPLDRLTYVTDQIGDISAVLDSINGETLEG